MSVLVITMTRPSRSRNWCFTTYTLDINFEAIYASGVIRYLCVGKEICPSTGRHHLQGWFQLLKETSSIKNLKKLLTDPTVHLEQCKGSPTENDTYCQKEKDFKIYGEHTSQGARSDLAHVSSRIIKGDNMMDIINDHPATYVQYGRGMRDLQQTLAREARKGFRKISTTWIYGPTNTGKTRHAMSFAPYKIQASDMKWFDGYQGESILLIDEYNNDLPITTLLRLLDGYECRLPTKGGHTYANWTQIYITSNLTWQEIHPQAKPAHKDALRRRIHKLVDLYTHPEAAIFLRK